MSAPPFARVLRWLIPVVFLGVCAARNLPWRLGDYDQAKQAFVSLELAHGGDAWFQHTPRPERLATKPPLVGWLSAGFHAALPRFEGDWELAWRLPSALATAALSVLLWRAGRSLWPAAGGWLALGSFGLNGLTPRLATLVRTDMALALWTTAAGLLVWRQRRRGGGPWTRGERWALGAVLTAAMLTKGPVVYAFLLPGLAALAVGERPRVSAAALAPWVVPLAVFALWVGVGCATVPGFYGQVVGREFLGRFDYSGSAVHTRQPVWFYAAGLLARLAPWSLLLGASAFLARPAWRETWRDDPAGRWLIAWVAGGLLLMSLVPSKRVDRIFPVVPPLCLLLVTVVGRAAARGNAPGAGRRVETLAGWTAAAAVAVAVAATVYETRKSFHRHGDALDRFGRQVRRLGAAHGWRPPELAVGDRVDESDDTLLVCLRRLRWLDNAAAAEAWRTGRTDALVLQTTTLPELQSALGTEGADYVVAARMAATRERDVPYVLVVRRAPGGPASPGGG